MKFILTKVSLFFLAYCRPRFSQEAGAIICHWSLICKSINSVMDGSVLRDICDSSTHFTAKHIKCWKNSCTHLLVQSKQILIPIPIPIQMKSILQLR